MKISDFKYDKILDGYRITGYKGSCSDIEIPEGVVEIAYGAFSWHNAESIIFPKSLKKISCEAFSYCEKLMEVTFPAGCALAEIESHAFLDCESLKEIILPHGLKKIGEFAFAGCKSLVKAFIPSSVSVIEENAFEYANKKFLIKVDMSKIPSGFHKDWNMRADFELCSSASSVQAKPTAPKATAIPQNPPKQPAQATSVKTPSAPKAPATKSSVSAPAPAPIKKPFNPSLSVAPIKKTSPAEAYTPMEKFEVQDSRYGKILVKCLDKNIEHLVVPPEINIIGPKAFFRSHNLKTIKGHPELSLIDSQAFKECSSLASVDIADNTSLGEYAFSETALTHAKLNFNTYEAVYSSCPIETVSFPVLKDGYRETLIRPHLFSHTKLKSIDIPEGIDSIMTGAFMACTELRSVKLPKSLYSLWPGAFASCYSLEEITLPEKIRELPNGVFKFCRNLKKINLDNISMICTEALYGCHSLEEIRIPSKLYRIGSTAIYSKSLKRIVFEGRTSERLAKLSKGDSWFLMGDHDVELVFTDKTVVLRKGR